MHSRINDLRRNKMQNDCKVSGKIMIIYRKEKFSIKIQANGHYLSKKNHINMEAIYSMLCIII